MTPLRSSIIFALFRAEMRMMLRDRRVITTSIILPLALTPLMFLGSQRVLHLREKKLEEMVCRYSLSGTETNYLRELIEATRQRLPAATNRDTAFKFTEVPTGDPEAALAQDDIEIILEASAGQGTSNSIAAARGQGSGVRRRGGRGSGEQDEGEAQLAGVPVVRIVFRGDRDSSARAMSRMNDALRLTRREQRTELLRTKGFDLSPEQMAVVHERDLATAGQAAGLRLGRVITLMLMLFVLTGGSVAATDSLAGEKERGTLETLLTTSAGRLEIIAAKHLVVLAVALVIALIQTANLFVYAGLKLLPGSAHFGAAVTPFVVLLLLVLYLPMLALAASVQLLVSGHAKTYKEAQMFFFPVFLLGLAPALAPLLPGLSLRSVVVLVPVANIALAAREILTGSFDWPMIVLSWLLTAGTAVWTMRVGARWLSAERLVVSTGADADALAGGEVLFSRQVLRWFALLWALLLLVNNYLEKADLRWQLLMNLVVLLFGGSCLMLRSYRLDPREALALRAPRPAIWLAVLIAVPAGLLTASGVFRLANLFVPISSELMRQFDQSLIPARISLAQLLLFMSVLPAIFEEIAFRGLLLHGLNRRLNPVAVTVVVGLIFGLFHVALFRFAPTACLGMMLAAVRLLSGSIYPAMLWHGLSNATGLLAYRFGIPLEELDPRSYLLGTGLLAVAFWIIWRNRTPDQVKNADA